MVTLVLIFAIAFALSFIPLGVTSLRNYLRFRRPAAVPCPETGGEATVSVNAGRTALSAAVREEPRVRISSCSNWPRHEKCGRGCAEDVLCSLSASR